MAYSVAQFIKTELPTPYYTAIGYTRGRVINGNGVEKFSDVSLDITDVSRLNINNSFYIRFAVKQLRTEQDFDLVLVNSATQEDNTQVIKSYTVAPDNAETGKVVFELIFEPNNVYDQLVFRLSRDSVDFNMENLDGTNGRLMTISDIEFVKLTNVVDYLKTKCAGLKELRKIGIQGPPGMLMAINGEEIHIGRSGLYEIHYDGISITSVGFMPRTAQVTQDGEDFFIMDFKY